MQPKRRKVQKKKGESNASEIAFDLEREGRPPNIELSSTATEEGEETRPRPITKEENDETRGKMKSPTNMKVPVKASSSWEWQKNGPTRVLERKRVPTRRYGIDVMKIAKSG